MEGKVYGYEDYETKDLSVWSVFRGNNESWDNSYSLGRYTENLLCVDHDVLAYSRFSRNSEYRLEVDILDHPSLLNSAEKLYVHPSCSISRDLVRKKYKRVLNMVAADAVVLPSGHDETSLNRRTLLFANDDTMELYVCEMPSYGEDSYYRTTYPYYVYIQTYDECVNNIGIRIRDISTICRNLPEEILDAKLVYAGPTTTVSAKQQYIFDYLTGLLPKDRIVLEKDVLKTLGDETNVPTVDSMMNIYQMMKSDDRAVRELGFKALAMMDYINYPESTRLILDNTNWYMDNNYKPSAVRFMLDSLNVKICRRRRASQSTQIGQKDWEIAKELMKRIKNLDDKGFIRYCTYNVYYTYVDENNVVHPRLMKE